MFDIFLCDAFSAEKVRADDTSIEQDICYQHVHLKEGCMEGLLSNDLMTRGLEQQYVCISNKDLSEPDRNVEHGDCKDHFLWVDKELGHGILNMHGYKPVVLKLVPSHFDETSNVFARSTHYVGDDDSAQRSSAPPRVPTCYMDMYAVHVFRWGSDP